MKVKGSDSMRYRKLGAMVAGGLTLAWAASASADAITYLTQSRSVTASTSVEGFARGGTSTSPTTDTQNQTQTADGFATFNGNASVSSALGADAPMATGSASQMSMLGSTGFTAEGTVAANSSLAEQIGPGTGSGSTSFHITFNVAQAMSYTFSATLNSSVAPAFPGNTSASLSMTGPGGVNVFAPITTVNITGFTSKGTLAAGQYTVMMDANATSNDESSEFVNYDFSLADGAPITQLDGTASAVPLPVAAPVALVMLGGLGVGGFVQRRYRGWVRDSLA
jgi:hypothetical protein